MKSRTQILDQTLERGVGPKRQKLNLTQAKKAKEFFQKHDQQDSSIEQMFRDFQSSGSTYDGLTAEVIHTAINSYREQIK